MSTRLSRKVECDRGARNQFIEATRFGLGEGKLGLQITLEDRANGQFMFICLNKKQAIDMCLDIVRGLTELDKN